MLSSLKKYGAIRKDVVYWLENTEQRLDQMSKEPLNQNAIQVLYKELRVRNIILPFLGIVLPFGIPFCSVEWTDLVRTFIVFCFG